MFTLLSIHLLISKLSLSSQLADLLSLFIHCGLRSNISCKLFHQQYFWLFQTNLWSFALIFGLLSNTVLPLHDFQLELHPFEFLMIAFVYVVVSFLLVIQSVPWIVWNLFSTHLLELFLKPFYTTIFLLVQVLSILIVFCNSILKK